jgi:LuxR family maltose regulon positive regulatory protein
MDEGFARKLTLISAPAGFGKTTLSVDWAHTHKIPVAWFSVDNGDNDPLYFPLWRCCNHRNHHHLNPS